MAAPVVHFEVMGTDRQALGRFYGELFGWTVQSLDQPPYEVIDTRSGAGIDGGIGAVDDAGAQYVSVYAQTEDIHKTFDRAVEMGAEVMLPVSEVPGVVTFAILRDPQGNVFGMVTPGEGPGVSEGDGVSVDWFEFTVPDPKALHDFYVELFGWEPMASEGELAEGDYVYYQVNTGDGGIGGGFGNSPDGRSHFALYATVDELQPYIDRAEELGGSTALPPMKVAHVEFAQVKDPQGNVFGLYKRRPGD
ncbi:MAG: VOC family protein [Actinomycetota bacterium]